MKNGNGVSVSNEKGFLSRRVLDIVLIAQIVVNLVVLGLIIAGLIFALGELNQQSDRQEQLTRAQLEFVQGQNDQQLCAQHDIIFAIQKLANGFERTLGLPPLTHITVPDVTGLDCRRGDS